MIFTKSYTNGRKLIYSNIYRRTLYFQRYFEISNPTRFFPCSSDSIIPKVVTQTVDESEPTSQTKDTSITIPEESEGTTGTEVTDITTESSAEVTEKQSENEDQYEIVPDTNCDDGEWVEVESTSQVGIVKLFHILDFYMVYFRNELIEK